MQCPQDPDTTLVMTDRQGIEIDYCPKCRGVWLDRGELDKLIERGATAVAAASPPPAMPAQPQQQPPQPQQPFGRPDFADSDWGKRQGGYGYRKKSWLSEIFD